jgi:hypothetical protein
MCIAPPYLPAFAVKHLIFVLDINFLTLILKEFAPAECLICGEFAIIKIWIIH